VGWAALLPISGLAAPALWKLLFERACMAVLGIDALALRAPLDRLSAWLPTWALLLLLGMVAWAFGSGAVRRRGVEGERTTPGGQGPLQDQLPALPGETAWLSWVGQPASLYRLFGRLLGRAAGGTRRVANFLERHTTYFLLFVLVAAGAVLIFLTR